MHGKGVFAAQARGGRRLARERGSGRSLAAARLASRPIRCCQSNSHSLAYLEQLRCSAGQAQFAGPLPHGS
jgi:hypothetical protein